MRRFCAKYAALFAAALLVSGCHQNTETQTAANVQAIQAEWMHSENELLQYVPEDTAFVLASTRNFDRSSGLMTTLFKPILSGLQPQTGDIRRATEGWIKDWMKYGGGLDQREVSEVLRIARAFEDALIDLEMNYEIQASSWGLDMDGHHDIVIYLDGIRPVAHLKVADAQVFRAKIEEIAGINRDISDGVEQKSTESRDAILEIKDEIVDGRTWTMYFPTKARDENGQIHQAIAVHYGEHGEITMTLLGEFNDRISFGKDTNQLNQYCIRAEHPMKRPAEAASDVTLYAQKDYKRLYEHWTTHIGSLNRLTGDETRLFKRYTDIVSGTNWAVHVDDNRIHLEYHVIIADESTKSRFESIMVPLRPFSGQETGGLRAGADLNKFVNYLKEYLTRTEMSQDEVDGMVSSNVQELVNSLTDPPLNRVTAGMTGMIAEIKEVDFSQDIIVFEGNAGIFGSNVSDIMRDVYDMFGVTNTFPAVNHPQSFGLAFPLNTEGLMQSPIQEMLTDQSYMLTTQAYDVSQLSAASSEKVDKFVDFHMKRKLVDMIWPKLSLPRQYCRRYEISSDLCQNLIPNALRALPEESMIGASVGMDTRGVALDLEINLK